MGEHWFLLSLAAVVGATGAVAFALAALRCRETPLDDTQSIPAVERWEAIRDYLIDDPEMRALVDPLFRGPSET